MKFFTKRSTVILILFLLSYAGAIAQNYCITDIYINGNKRTKRPVILRELPFAAGDCLPEESLQKKILIATENLYNASLFNVVNITYQADSTVTEGDIPCTVTVHLEERWYYWPLINIKLEDRNLSAWLKHTDLKRITFDLGVKIDNVWGMGHKFSAGGLFGFERGINISYTNVVLDPMGMHSLGFEFHALFNKTVNVISEFDKPVYMKNLDDFLDQSVGGEFSYTYRPAIRTKHTLTIGYEHSVINDSVLIRNPDYWGTNNTVNRKISLSYAYSFDQRNYKIYPTEGYFIGLELKGNADDDFNFLYGQAYADLQYYLKLGNRWFWDTQLKAGLSLKNRDAYIYDQAIGYENVNVAGYDYYAIDGQQFVTLSNGVRFLILPTKVVTFNFLRWLSKFYKTHFTIYGKVFADMGYVHQNNPCPNNKLPNTFLFGSGVGIEVLTYYDVVLSLSYAINKNGESGFFFGIKSPIF